MFKEAARIVCMFTCTQLLVTSAAFLVIITPLFGIKYAAVTLVCYAVSHLLLNVDLRSAVTTLSAASADRGTGNAVQDNFSDAQSEIENIKSLISKSFILSWTRELSLAEDTELDIMYTADSALDKLLTTLSTEVSVYHVINDIIKAAHIHVLRYNAAKVEQVRKKRSKQSIDVGQTTVKSRFLDLSLKEWAQAHPASEYSQRKYIRSVTENLALLLLPENPSPLALEVLSSIISENVLGELLKYLSQQENLLKLIIRVFSDDYEDLLQSAEIKNLECATPTDELNPIITDRGAADTESKSVTFSLECSKPDNQNRLSVDESRHVTAKKQDLNVADENTTSPSDDCPISPGQFYSDDLTKYFKVAPNTPKKASGSADKDNSQSDNEAPKTVSMLMMSPAILTHNPDSENTADTYPGNQSVTDIETPKIMPMMTMTVAAPSSPTQTFTNPIFGITQSSEQADAEHDDNQHVASADSSTDDVIHTDSYSPLIVPMSAMMPATTITTTETSLAIKPDPPKSLPLSTVSAAQPVRSGVSGRLKKRLSFQKSASIESRSYDSGVVSDVVPASVAERGALNIQSDPEEGGELLESHASSSSQISVLSESSMEQRGMKFVSISIPSTQLRVEKTGSQYTLYDIHYKATYPDTESSNGCSVKERVVYRRYREFINLRARLQKANQFSKSLKSIKTPRWWQQLSLTTLKPSEVEKRRQQLEIFLMQLIANPSINICKDLEQFLAYDGGAEIEFVQEIVEFIPPSARIDKRVLKTMSGVFDKVTDKLTYHGSQTALDSRKSVDTSKSLEGDSQGLTHSLVYCRARKIDSDLLYVREDIQNYTATENPEIETANLEEVDNNEVTGASFDAVQDSQLLAGSIFQILLLLLQNHSDLSKNDKLVSTVNTIFVPLFGKWLRNKVDIYTKPDQVHRFLVLFRSAVWPQVEEQSANYDIDKLKVIAKQCIHLELPSLVSFIAASQVDNILDDVLNATEHSELNEQLGLAILCQCIQNSLSVLK